MDKRLRFMADLIEPLVALTSTSVITWLRSPLS
jgi:hypothetical protein